MSEAFEPHTNALHLCLQCANLFFPGHSLSFFACIACYTCRSKSGSRNSHCLSNLATKAAQLGGAFKGSAIFEGLQSLCSSAMWYWTPSAASYINLLTDVPHLMTSVTITLSTCALWSELLLEGAFNLKSIHRYWHVTLSHWRCSLLPAGFYEILAGAWAPLPQASYAPYCTVWVILRRLEPPAC